MPALSSLLRGARQSVAPVSTRNRASYGFLDLTKFERVTVTFVRPINLFSASADLAKECSGRRNKGKERCHARHAQSGPARTNADSRNAASSAGSLVRMLLLDLGHGADLS